MIILRKHITLAAAIITIAVSCLVLSGWVLNVGIFKSVMPVYISMKFNTAVCFLLTGISLLLFDKQKAWSLINLFSFLVIIISLLTISEYIFNSNLGIDELLWPDDAAAVNTLFPGRPSAVSAFNFIIINTLLIVIRQKKTYVISWISLYICFLSASFSLISYFFGNPNLISISSFTVMALHTSVLFLILCLGIYKTPYFHLIEITFKKQLIGGFLSVAIVFMLIFYLDNKNDEHFIDKARLVANTDKAILLADDIVSSITTIESGVRGYLVTDDKGLLHSLDSGRGQIFINIAQLKNLINTPSHLELAKIDTLSFLVSRRIYLFDKELYAKATFNKSDIKKGIAESADLMNRIMIIINEIKTGQRKKFEIKQAENNKEIISADKSIYFFGFCMLIILIILLVIILRNTNVRIKAEEEARQLTLNLEKRVEARTHELMKAQTQFRFTLDNMLEGVQIIDFDWNFVYVNDSMLQQVKYTREGLIGFSVKDKYPGFERTKVYKACMRCFEEREPFHIEDKFVYNDGSISYFECSIQPVPEGVFILSVDITDRKVAMEKIKANEDKYRAVIDNSLFAILLARPGEKVFECNSAATELFGYTEKEFLNITREDLLDFSDPALVRSLRDRDMNGSSKGEFVGIKKNGEKFHCEVTSVIFKDINGEKMSCAMIADISQRKLTEEKLKDANEELRKLTLHLNSVREDERNKLSREVQEELGQLASALKMDIDWLNLHIPDPDVKTQARMKNALYVLQMMINSTRKIASSLRPGMIDELGLNATLKWQCNEFQKINKLSCVFHENCDDSNLSIEVRTELFRICQESLSNVLRHAHAAEVNVTISKTDSGLELCVSDNGIGFDQSSKSEHLGLIGLRERAHSINGELIIETEVGKGTTIRVLIPVE